MPKYSKNLAPKDVSPETPSGSSQQPSSPSADSSFDTLHGPVLEGDDPAQIYDNWGGDLRYSMPSNPDLDEEGCELPDHPDDTDTETEPEELDNALGQPPHPDLSHFASLFPVQARSSQSLLETLGELLPL